MPNFGWFKKKSASREMVNPLDFLEVFIEQATSPPEAADQADTLDLSIPSRPGTGNEPGPNRRAQGAARMPHGDARWVDPQTTITIQGIDIPGGMFYIGKSLKTKWGTNDPALIDGALPINDKDSRGVVPYAYQSTVNYSAMSPRQRFDYLQWLAHGRGMEHFTSVNLSLFIAGLERRVLVDIAANPDLEPELPVIRDELTRLLDIRENSTQSYMYYYSDGIIRFRDTIDYLMARRESRDWIPPVPDVSITRWVQPATLELALSRFAAAKVPLPPDWAYVWLWFSPLRSEGATDLRAPDELRDLFMKRYVEEYGDGIKLRQSRTRLRLGYTCVNLGLGNHYWDEPDLSRIYHLKKPMQQLLEIRTRSVTELGAYVRMLGREPDEAGTLRALALLPPALIHQDQERFKPFTAWLEGRFQASHLALVSGQDLLDQWTTLPLEKLARGETTRFGKLLWHLGYGIEPNLASGGGPLLTPDAVYVLFRLGAGASDHLSTKYTTATLICRLATIVMKVDGEVVPAEMDALGAYLERSMSLEPAERIRMFAHIVVLQSTEPRTTGIKQQAAGIPLTQREAIGNLLAAIAASDGTVSPAETRMLEKLFRALSLDPKSIHSRIHAALTGEFAHSAPKAAGNSGTARHHRKTGLNLDEQAIRAKMVETAEVSSLLGDLFAEDEIATPPPVVTPVPESGDTSIAGLDPAHSHLVRLLARQPEWTRESFDQLVDSLHLLPAGAIDALNEAAYEATDEPLIEGDAHLIINTYVLETMTQ